MLELFHRELFTSPKTTWALGQLSQSTSNAIVDYIDQKSIKTIVEFWPWRWNITQKILDALPKDGQLICFEINKKDFEPYLKKIRDPRLNIHYTSCEDIDAYCDKNSIDMIISTIPLSLLPKETMKSILHKSHHCLTLGWTFLTAQYSFYSQAYLHTIFGNSAKKRHLRNLPPVCIVTSNKVSENLS